MIKANDPILQLRGRPIDADCRILSEENYQLAVAALKAVRPDPVEEVAQALIHAWTLTGQIRSGGLEAYTIGMQEVLKQRARSHAQQLLGSFSTRTMSG